MQLEIVGTQCPHLPGVVVGVQRGSEVVDERAAGGDDLRWVIDVNVVDGDFRGPFVHGPRGGRFLYLSWSQAGTGRFRRAKLMLDAVPADTLTQAQTTMLRAQVALVMADGSPVCAAVRPPAISWSAAPTAQ